MRHINIPIFIPHLGCPNQCIFCNQRFISGTYQFDESVVDNIINQALTTIDKDDECEIAFFGGSFTGIDRSLMIRLLDKAQGYVDKGLAIGIRMSTRPDYINEEIIRILKKYTITCVELGVQSMNDEVLKYLKRGHTAVDTINATKLLKNAKINFVGQMMIGLPSANIQDEIYTAKVISRLGASGTRIYPTLVFKNTELEDLTNNGEYRPISLDEAVERSAKVLEVFIKNNIPCLRIGLCESDNLHSEDSYIAGPNSPSIGEMVKSQVYYNLIFKSLKNSSLMKLESLYIECANGCISQIIGNKKKNVDKLKKTFGFKYIKVKENNNLMQYQLILKEKEESKDAFKIT
ncbi:MAG: radical SAM protein [Ruminococcaceae bacterium]|nr:radical SAM protein [Oscillospiraceae bacterium]